MLLSWRKNQKDRLSGFCFDKADCDDDVIHILLNLFKEQDIVG